MSTSPILCQVTESLTKLLLTVPGPKYNDTSVRRLYYSSLKALLLNGEGACCDPRVFEEDFLLIDQRTPQQLRCDAIKEVFALFRSKEFTLRDRNLENCDRNNKNSAFRVISLFLPLCLSFSKQRKLIFFVRSKLADMLNDETIPTSERRLCFLSAMQLEWHKKWISQLFSLLMECSELQRAIPFLYELILLGESGAGTLVQWCSMQLSHVLCCATQWCQESLSKEMMYRKGVIEAQRLLQNMGNLLQELVKTPIDRAVFTVAQANDMIKWWIRSSPLFFSVVFHVRALRSVTDTTVGLLLLCDLEADALTALEDAIVDRLSSRQDKNNANRGTMSSLSQDLQDMVATILDCATKVDGQSCLPQTVQLSLWLSTANYRHKARTEHQTLALLHLLPSFAPAAGCNEIAFMLWCHTLAVCSNTISDASDIRGCVMKCVEVVLSFFRSSFVLMLSPMVAKEGMRTLDVVLKTEHQAYGSNSNMPFSGRDEVVLFCLRGICTMDQICSDSGLLDEGDQKKHGLLSVQALSFHTDLLSMALQSSDRPFSTKLLGSLRRNAATHFYRALLGVHDRYWEEKACELLHESSLSSTIQFFLQTSTSCELLVDMYMEFWCRFDASKASHSIPFAKRILSWVSPFVVSHLNRTEKRGTRTASRIAVSFAVNLFLWESSSPSLRRSPSCVVSPSSCKEAKPKVAPTSVYFRFVDDEQRCRYQLCIHRPNIDVFEIDFRDLRVIFDAPEACLVDEYIYQYILSTLGQLLRREGLNHVQVLDTNSVADTNPVQAIFWIALCTIEAVLRINTIQNAFLETSLFVGRRNYASHVLSVTPGLLESINALYRLLLPVLKAIDKNPFGGTDIRSALQRHVTQLFHCVGLSLGFSNSNTSQSERLSKYDVARAQTDEDYLRLHLCALNTVLEFAFDPKNAHADNHLSHVLSQVDIGSLLSRLLSLRYEESAELLSNLVDCLIQRSPSFAPDAQLMLDTEAVLKSTRFWKLHRSATVTALIPKIPLLARIEGIKAAINTGARNRALRGLYVFNAEIRRSRDQPIARTEMICEVLECCAALAQSALASLSTEQLDKPKRDWLFLLGVLGTISLLAANLAKIKPTQRQRAVLDHYMRGLIVPALVLIPAVHFGAISEALKTVREICSAISLVVYVPLHSRGTTLLEGAYWLSTDERAWNGEDLPLVVSWFHCLFRDIMNGAICRAHRGNGKAQECLQRSSHGVSTCAVMLLSAILSYRDSDSRRSSHVIFKESFENLYNSIIGDLHSKAAWSDTVEQQVLMLKGHLFCSLLSESCIRNVPPRLVAEIISGVDVVLAEALHMVSTSTLEETDLVPFSLRNLSLRLVGSSLGYLSLDDHILRSVSTLSHHLPNTHNRIDALLRRACKEKEEPPSPLSLRLCLAILCRMSSSSSADPLLPGLEAEGETTHQHLIRLSLRHSDYYVRCGASDALMCGNLSSKRELRDVADQAVAVLSQFTRYAMILRSMLSSNAMLSCICPSTTTKDTSSTSTCALLSRFDDSGLNPPLHHLLQRMVSELQQELVAMEEERVASGALFSWLATARCTCQILQPTV